MLTMESRMHRKVHVRFGGGVTAASPKQNNVHICSAWAASRTLPYNVGAAPETRSTGSGDTVCTIRMATSESWTDKASGEKKEITEWHRVVFYRKQAELVKQLVKKGTQLYVEGRLKTRKWTDKDSVERYTTEIEAAEFQLLGSRPQSSGNSDEHGSTEPAPSSPRDQQSTGTRNAAGGGQAYGDSDIPF